MSMAVIGSIISIGGTAYSIYSQNRAIDAANSTNPRPFQPIDIAGTARLALEADKLGYKTSDQDFANRFPQLVSGRAFNIADSAAQLSGGTSRQLTDSMAKAGVSANLGTDEFQKAQNLGKPILGIEQRDRNYFSRLMAENPQRQAGLTGADVTKLAAQNTGGQNAYNSQIFGNQIAKYNASIAQGMQNQYAATSGLASLAGLLSDSNRSKPQQSGYLDPTYFTHLGQAIQQQPPSFFGG